MRFAGLLRAHVMAVNCVATAAGWTELEAVPSGEAVKLTLGLKQRNLARLEYLFWEISDPQSSIYGNFLPLNDIAEIVDPSSESRNVVLSWAATAGAFDVHMHATRDYISLKLNASVVAAELDADLRRYRESMSGLDVVRALGGYTLPDALRDHVDLIFPLSELPASRQRRPRRRKSRKRTQLPSASWPSDCDAGGGTGKFDVEYPVTPDVIYQTYNISKAIRATRLGSLAAAGSEDYEDQFNPADVNMFGRHCQLPPLNFTDYGDGKVPDRSRCALDGDYECGEGTLDITNEHMCAPFVPIQYWTTKHDHYLSWMTQINDQTEAALVHSLSSGDPEEEVSPVGGPFLTEEVSAETWRRVDTEFMKAGLRGLTLLFSSGDSGPWDATTAVEEGDVGQDELKKGSRFKAMYPAVSPYVTSVGGTEFGKCGQVGGEVAVRVESPCYDEPPPHNTAGFSGGGFSNKYTPPGYTAKFVQSWMHDAKEADELPPAWYWNQSGAGYPDVSALAVAENIMGGSWDFSGGTSSSSPFFAGVVGLLNGARLSRGLPPMGFINPWLYKVAAKHAHAFQDITEGNNYFHKKGKIGYKARRGWDPVTGLGTPNVGVLS